LNGDGPILFSLGRIGEISLDLENMMPKRLFLILLLIPLLLAACSGETQTPLVEDTASADTIPAPSDTAPVPTAINTPEPTETVAAQEKEQSEPTAVTDAGMGCTFVSSSEETPSPYAEIFAVTEDDWVAGPETAAVTIVEYSDFQ
jgi:protein-disulfide isomerase